MLLLPLHGYNCPTLDFKKQYPKLDPGEHAYVHDWHCAFI